jgi:hypothetical protein
MPDLLELRSLPIVDKDGNATAYFEDAWYQLILAVGGEGAPPITETTNSTVLSIAPPANIDDIYVHSISSNYTTIGNELIQVSAACTVTLNATPKFKELVSVQSIGNFLVTISGTINGQSSLIIHHAYDLITIEYTELGWVIK